MEFTIAHKKQINIMEDLEKLMEKAIKDLEKLRSSLDVCDKD